MSELIDGFVQGADQIELKVATQVHEEKNNYPMQVGACFVCDLKL